MAAILFAGYLGAICYNLRQTTPEKRMHLAWLLPIGVGVQLGWEAGLLLGGIRSAGFASFSEKLRTLVVNSLLETNLGMPYVYCIFIAYTRRFTECLGRREKALSFADRIAENNRERVK